MPKHTKSTDTKRKLHEEEWSEDVYISGETEHSKLFLRLILSFVAGLFMTAFTGAIFLNNWTEVLLVFVLFAFGFYISATLYKIP
jgi:hypothetical protein